MNPQPAPPALQDAPPSAPTLGRCQFVFADGRTCRMLRWDRRSVFCLPHAREEQQFIAERNVAAQFAPLSGGFWTAREINLALGTLLSLRAQNKISSRDASTLAFIGQLLLQTLPTLREELKLASTSRRSQGTAGNSRTKRELTHAP